MNDKELVSRSTVSSKLSRRMTLQVSLIGLVAVLSIGVASIVIEQFLVRQALMGEAEHFWQFRTQNPNMMPPNTANLKGFVTEAGSDEGLPLELRGYDLGFQKIHGQLAHSLMFTEEKNGQRLTLLFDGKSVTRLALFFGVLPLTIVLLLVYISAWWVYRESSYLLSPIIWLANKLDRFDPGDSRSSLADLSDIPGDVDWEVEKLVKSFSQYSRRISSFVERERIFTRDASHEFRTPLTVIKMASDLLLAERELNDYERKNVERIRGSVRDMEELIEAFLILARETDLEFEEERIEVFEIVESEVEKARVHLDGKPIHIQIDEQYPTRVNAAVKLLSIVLGNLIRNAVLYTEKGRVTISLHRDHVAIADTGIGMDEEQTKKIFQPYYRANKASRQGFEDRKGYGVGLTIVKRLADRCGWTVDVESEINVGTKMEVHFNS